MFGARGPGIAVVIFGLTVAASLYGLYRSPQFIERWLFRPYRFLRERRYETIVTSGFVHADFAHLLFNMVTFYFFGDRKSTRLNSSHSQISYAVFCLKKKNKKKKN